MDQTPTPRREPTGPPEESYPFIRAWGHLMGSVPSYIRQQISLARAEGAPATAVYRTIEGTWAIIGDITRADTRRDLGLDPLPARAPTAAELTGHLRDLIGASDHLRDVHGLSEITSLKGQGLRLVFGTGQTARLHLDLTGPEVAGGVDAPSATPEPTGEPAPSRPQGPARPGGLIRPRSGDHDNPPAPNTSRRPT